MPPLQPESKHHPLMGLIAVLALLCPACSSLPFDLPFELPFGLAGPGFPSGVQSIDPPPVVDPPFSGEAAFAHLEAIYALGPRPAGSEALGRARTYLTEQFEALGGEVVPITAKAPLGPEGSELSLTVLTVEFAGESDQLVMLVAPLDTASVEGVEFAGANEGASGPAVAIEFARALTQSQSPLPYTLQFAFPEGDRMQPRASYGSEVLLATLRELDVLRQLRAVIYLDSVGDADLRIVRDGNSNRRLRGALFDAASGVGQSSAFPATAPFETPYAGHKRFSRSSIPTVLITDTTYGGVESPGLHWRTEADTPQATSPASLEAVGDVLLAALESEMARWSRLDQLASRGGDDPAPAATPADAEPPASSLDEPERELEPEPELELEPPAEIEPEPLS